MSDLSPGWRATTLGQLGRYLNGRGFKKSEWRESGRPIIRIQNLTGSSGIYNYFDGQAEDRYTARSGDLLVSWAATLGAYLWTGPEAVVNQHIFKVESSINTKFHKYLLDYKLGDLAAETHGSGMVHITRGRFDAMPVVVPIELAEQRRIVAILEDHFSRLDAAETYIKASGRRIETHARSVIDSIMVGGAATGGWDIAPLEAFAAAGRGSMTDGPFGSSLTSAHYSVSGAQVVRLQNIGDGFFKSGEAFIPISHYESLIKHDVRSGDVVIASLGDVLPRAALVPDLGGPAIVKADCIRLRTEDPSDAAWVVAACRSTLAKRWAAERLHGVGRLRLGMAGIRAVPLPRPPSSGARDDALTVIEQGLAAGEQLSGVLKIQTVRLDGLRRALLAAAFSGRLTGRSSDLDLVEEIAATEVVA